MQKKNMKTIPHKSDELNRYWIMMVRNWYLVAAVLLLCFAAGAFITYKTKPVYRATAQLIIEKEKERYYSTYKEEVDVDTSDLDYYQTQYKLIKKRGLVQQVAKKLKLDEVPEFSEDGTDPADELLEHIEVEPVKGSRLVNVSVDSRSPELAAKIVNTLADMYMRENLENRLYASREILNKLPQGFTVASLTDQDIRESLPSVVSNPLIQSLKNELIKYEGEYANLSKRYKDKHPAMVTAQARIDYIRHQIDREVEHAVDSVKTELAGGFKANNVRVVEYANIPSSPVRPNKPGNLAFACAIGLALGMGIVYFRENIDTSIKDGAEVEQYLDIPFLGVVPAVRKIKEGRPITRETDAASAEAIKTIRTNITFSVPEGKLKTLLVTSCAPASGKTLASLNIAASFCQIGNRVLLVDMDLRRATLTKQLKMEKKPGVSNFIVGNIGADEVVFKTDIENMYFMPAGTYTPNPAELLGSRKVKELIGDIRNEYDRIVFDSAPVFPVSDTLNVAPLMDGVVYVVYCGKLNRRIIGLGKRKLEDVGAKVAGAILNHVNIKARGYDYSYHTYGDYY